MLVEMEITIINRLGLHARACAKLVKAAAHYESRIELLQGEQCADAKSIMGLMMLAASLGCSIKISAEGADAEIALAELVALVKNGFGENDAD